MYTSVRSINDHQAKLVAGHFHHGAAGDALQDVLGDQWGDQNIITNNPNLHRTAFGYMSILGQDKVFVKTGPSGIGFDQHRAHIVTADLAACQDGIIIDPPPGGDGHVGIVIILVIPVKRYGKDRHFILDIMQAYADDFIRLVGQGVDVDILAVTILA